MKQVFNQPFSTQPFTIGILGGGQLAKMMAQVAKKMNFGVQVLDPTPHCPAEQVVDKQVVGDFYDEKQITAIVTTSDVTTYDIEHINSIVLTKLKKQGYQIYPSPQILDTIQDRSKQKEILQTAGLPTPNYQLAKSTKLQQAIKKLNTGYPIVQKARKGGYDGRGTLIIRSHKELKTAIQADSIVEEFVEIKKELAINIARSTTGEIKCHPVVETIFDQQANICDLVIAPARINSKIKKTVEELGEAVVEALGKEAVGIFGIEMFLSQDDKVLINEIAPRPHNSGHYSIEACATSQFEQHLRAISGLPLGSTRLLSPTVMVNILGSQGFEGQAVYQGITEALVIDGASVHIYGKHVSKPFRKMGHVTVVDSQPEQALRKALKIKKMIKTKKPKN